MFDTSTEFYSVFDADELPPEELYQWFLGTERTVIVLNTIVVTITLIVMSTSSRTMLKRYHYFLINEIVCFLTSDLAVYLNGLMILFPTPCFVLGGPINYLTTSLTTWTLVVVINTVTARIAALFRLE
ncbi:unnamed protein product [Bursaphelenchus okinawaensis]|uniref:Uncharacterized protein n=1 Tax=Bursaphelenchus okinawaensis TaxID=465554 RepID=A0A811KEF8_9BILA|nr:unnamed protein product [Bursaphelenchus okinawaensis]CAG9103164.1 unnamed protein product [Bursaphelenchus okinawaensis]